MKKIFVLSFFVIFLFSGCELFELQMPEKVSVRTKAEYNFSLVDIEMDLEKDVDIPGLINSQIGDSHLRIYDYNPGGNQETQQYLLEYKPDAFEIDLSDSLSGVGDLNLGSYLEIKESDLPKAEITVPEIPISVPDKEISVSGSGTAPLSETEVTVNDFEIDAIKVEGISDCKIGEGSLEFEVIFDKSWSGGSVTWETLSLTGGIQVANENFERSGNKCTASLEGVPLDISGTKKTTINCTIKVKADSADFSNPPKIKVTPYISKIESVTVELPAEMKTDFHIEEACPDALKDYVSKIDMGASEINVTYTNGLPAGNDISLQCSSDFLGFSKTDPNNTKTLDAGKSEKTVTYTATGGPKEITNETKIDFSATISSTYIDTENKKITLIDTEKKKITLKNVEPDKTYNFKVAVEFKPKINSVTIKLPTDFTGKLSGKKDMSFNPKSEIDKIKTDVFKNKGDIPDFIDNIYINNLNAYLFIKEPDVLKNLKIKGKANVGFKQADDTVSEIIKLIKKENTVGFVKNFPSMPAPDSKEKTVTTKIGDLTASCKIAPESEEIHNALFPATDSGNLWFDYDLKVGTDAEPNNTITVPWDDIKKICDGDDKKIRLELAAYFSVDFAITVNDKSSKGDLKLNLNDFLDEPITIGPLMETSPEELQTYLDAIKEVSLIYNTALPLKITNLEDKEDEIMLTAKIDFTEDGVKGIAPDPLTLKSGKIKVTNKDVSNILLKEFTPSLELSIPRGTYSVPRGMKISADMYMQVKTDGTISFDDVMGGNEI